ncbi:hypothetical protein ACFQ3W_08645 [Paenibacillus puldeungensis]|uniref:Acetyl-CoA acetyltransferase n=1 Tax=Paenibacillus puldeungensis TaxID=696536 RepID=A0ABW3RWZ6_9BACL
MDLQPMQQQVIYQADPTAMQNMQTVRSKINDLGKKHLNRYVSVQTMDGHTYQGVILGVESGIFYLGVQQTPGYRQYYDAILPLVLYELLVITLLYT